MHPGYAEAAFAAVRVRAVDVAFDLRQQLRGLVPREHGHPVAAADVHIVALRIGQRGPRVGQRTVAAAHATSADAVARTVSGDAATRGPVGLEQRAVAETLEDRNPARRLIRHVDRAAVRRHRDLEALGSEAERWRARGDSGLSQAARAGVLLVKEAIAVPREHE